MMSLWRFLRPEFGDCAVGTENAKLWLYSLSSNVKRIFIYRDFGQPSVDGLWDVFDDAGWMVRFLVDVEWNVSWFDV